MRVHVWQFSGGLLCPPVVGWGRGCRAELLEVNVQWVGKSGYVPICSEFSAFHSAVHCQHVQMPLLEFMRGDVLQIPGRETLLGGLSTEFMDCARG